MVKNNYLRDGTDFSDEAKLLYHLYAGEMKKYNSRKNLYLSLIVVSIIVCVIGVIIFTDNADPGLVTSSIGGLGTIIFIGLFATNKIKASVKKMDLVYLPVSQLKFQKGSILVDRSGVIDPTEFKFSNLDNEDILLVNETYKGLVKQSQEMPHVLSGTNTRELKNQDSDYKKENLKMYSEEVNFIDLNNNIENAFDRIKEYNVNLKAYKYDRNLLKSLNELKTDGAKNIVEESNEKEILDGIKKINGIIDIYQEDKDALIDIDDLCMEILQFQENSIPRMDVTVHSSLNQIALPGTYRFTNVIEKASYNYYCPSCNSEIIEKLENFDYSHNGKADNRVFFPANTLMEMVDLNNYVWKCPLCEYETDEPYPRHKMEDELFTQVYDKLYEENYLERLKVYNHINDEKRKYAEKAETLFHEVLRESRTKVDNIKSKIRTIHSEITAEEMTIKDLNSLLRKYKKIADDKARQIETDLNNQKMAIEEENAKSRKRIDDAVNTAKNNMDKSTKKYAKLERKDQSKRDAVQKQIATNTRRTAKACADTNRILLGYKPKGKYGKWYQKY